MQTIMGDVCMLINALLRRVLGSGADEQRRALLNDMFSGKQSGMQTFAIHAVACVTQMNGKL